MRDTLKLFTNTALYEASEALLEKLGVNFSPFVRGIRFNDYFQRNDFSYQYVQEVQQCVKDIWNIGYVNDTTFNGQTTSDDVKYDSLSIFACDIKPEVNFTRGLAVDLTRAFNRVCSKNVNNEFDMPVVVIMRQGQFLSISTCEHSDRKDGKGDKIGKVTILRNMNCEHLHAGHAQILELIAKDVHGCTSYEELHQKWFKSFNIDVLSDAFFDGYKTIYEDIIEYITGKRMVKEANKWVEHDNGTPCAEIMSEFASFNDPEKSVRDYVKNLMGRLVFIQFLQKKGWMGVPAGDSWEDGDPEFLQNLFANSDKKETFVDDVLEPLFNDLNTKRHGDLVTNQNVGVNIKVPYLNGGLFELDESDDTTFALPSRFLKKLFDFFASYNFTIDENAPDNVEIGVDPEMLGRIFENLLEDNKEKGAFYTPKEIVQYMCRESLIAYLTTCVVKKQGENHRSEDEIKDSVRQLLDDPDSIVPRMTAQHLEDFGGYIRNVKICDPAIGSGAFPMGLLNELVRCRASINAWAKDEYENLLTGDYAALKAEIICNNIYGVDIEKGAIDIARLRFWLSIIVDLKIPHALPNFDYKFMQGNSLITTFNGEYVNLDTKKQTHVKVTEMRAEKKKLYALKQKYYGSQGNRKHELAVEIKKSVLRLVSMQLGYELRAWYEKNVTQTTLDFGEDVITITFADIKSHLPQEKQNLVNHAESLYKQLNDNNVDVAKRALIDISFFDWRMMFTEVFDTEDSNGGFDIVIGNPPYIRQERLGMDYKTLLTSIYPSVGNGTADILVYFFGLGFEIMKNNAVLTFITSNKFLKTKYGKELRNTLSTDYDVPYFIDFFELPVFHNASTDAGITLLKKQKTTDETKYYPVKTLDNLDLTKLIKGSYLLTIKLETEWQFVDKSEVSLLDKINLNCITLKDFAKDKIFRGVTTGLNKVFVIKDKNISETLLASESKEMLKKYAISTDISKWNVKTEDAYIVSTYPSRKINIEDYPTLKRYLLSFGKERLEQTGKKYIIDGEEVKSRKKTCNKWYEIQDSTAYWQEFESPKIIYIHTAKKHQFFMDTCGYHINNSCYMIGSSSSFLFCFLNSKLFEWYKTKKFVAYGDGEEAGRCKLDYNKMVTVPIKADVDEIPFAKIVNETREKINCDEPVDLDVVDKVIDRMIYELYGLTNSEVKIIDPHEITSGEDSDLFKA